MLFPQDQTVSKDGNIKSKQPFPSPISNPPGIKPARRSTHLNIGRRNFAGQTNTLNPRRI
ncbi:predicted protein [Botrytis cinerea T4]|uniref:Uncharacterized protein n=1 Tax=Botryotinia fuckeliana (strain T4) TaxID=999810 RepID=G2XP68_BOTF4|nr:predicted protein [Botrytis cinerea T4]